MTQNAQSEHQALSSLIQARYDALPRSQRALARLVLENPSLACTCTTLELAARAGVSNATVVRFASALGFSGYTELQKYSRQVLIADRYIKEQPLSGNGASALENILERQKRQLDHSFSRLSQDEFDRVVDAIIAARRIYVTGVRAVFAPGHFLARMLNLFFLNTTFLPLAGEAAYEEVFKADENDLFFCISMSRYARQSYTLTELAAKRNVPVAVVTDNPLAPVARLADMTLVVAAESTTIISSVLGITALAEALLTALAARPGVGDVIRANLTMYENGLSPRIFLGEP